MHTNCLTCTNRKRRNNSSAKVHLAAGTIATLNWKISIYFNRAVRYSIRVIKNTIKAVSWFSCALPTLLVWLHHCIQAHPKLVVFYEIIITRSFYSNRTVKIIILLKQSSQAVLHLSDSSACEDIKKGSEDGEREVVFLKIFMHPQTLHACAHYTELRTSNLLIHNVTWLASLTDVVMQLFESFSICTDWVHRLYALLYSNRLMYTKYTSSYHS